MDWTEVGIVGALKSHGPSIIHDGQPHRLSLYNACAGSTQTGVLELENCLELLDQVKSNDIKLEISVEGESAIVVIDGHFCGFTPVNSPGIGWIAE
jgi:hypothetical protein